MLFRSPDSVTTIGNQAFGYQTNDDMSTSKKDGFQITGKTGSAAADYANNSGVSFNDPDAPTTTTTTDTTDVSGETTETTTVTETTDTTDVSGETTETTTVTETTDTTDVSGETTDTTDVSGETTETTTVTETTVTTDSDTPSENSCGDTTMDGKVDLLDAILLNKYLAGAVTFTEQQATNANCDQTDGTETVGEEDTTALIRFVLNMEGYQNLPHIDSNN